MASLRIPAGVGILHTLGFPAFRRNTQIALDRYWPRGWQHAYFIKAEMSQTCNKPS